MSDLSANRSWEELIPDALGLIFSNLPLQEILTVVPGVCKSWNRAVAGPHCWQQIDLEEWSHRAEPEQINRMVQLLVRRSCGSFQRLAVSSIPDDSLFSFIAEHGGSLLSLEVPRSEMSDAVVEQVAGRLSAITFLDISSCKKIGARALRAFGKHCKSLVGLRRTMHPLEVLDDVSQDEEALAIALGMPKLRHLELAYLRITTHGVMEILSHCPELEFLDIRGCWDVKLEEEWMKKRNVGLKVLGPTIVDSYGCQYCEGCSDSSDYSWESMDDDEVGIMEDDYGDEGEQLQVRFYGGGFNEAYSGVDWQSSP